MHHVELELLVENEMIGEICYCTAHSTQLDTVLVDTSIYLDKARSTHLAYFVSHLSSLDTYGLME